MSESPRAPPTATRALPTRVVRVLEICNKKGLHARASAKFVQTVEQFDAEVKVTRGNETVGGNSIMGLMMLAAAPAPRSRSSHGSEAPRGRRPGAARRATGEEDEDCPAPSGSLRRT